MKEVKLTDAEKDLMEIIWAKEKVFMKDILEAYQEPKPATTTIATLLKRMQNKDLVGYTLYGNSREYYPKVAKGEYFKEEMSSMIDRFFNSSVTQFASFFTSNAKLSQKQLKELREIIDQQIDEK
jgi:BlaI family transcriptional regulator, penicillinase repressor